MTSADQSEGLDWSMDSSFAISNRMFPPRYYGSYFKNTDLLAAQEDIVRVGVAVVVRARHRVEGAHLAREAVEEEEGRDEGAANAPSFAKSESISGINQTVAESFVRMCRSNGSGKMRLSKSKQKVAMKLKMKFEARLFTAEEIERMQEAGVEEYEETLDLEEQRRKNGRSGRSGRSRRSGSNS